MKLGTIRISLEQRRLLDRALSFARSSPIRGFRLRQLSQILFRASHDLSEDEELHPEWLQIFERVKPELERSHVLPDDILEDTVKFFESHSLFDLGLALLDPRAMRVVFLLGAGASKPKPSGIPTVKELLPQLLDRARRLDREDVTKLADFCEKRKIDNIEDLLTAAQLATFCSRNPTVLRLVNYLLYRGEDSQPTGRPQRRPGDDLSSVAFLQDTLQTLFGLLSSTMLPAKPNDIHRTIARYAKAHPASSVITTNYDCCMDLALGDVRKDFVYLLDFANDQNGSSPNHDCVQLIKLHGSLNWFYCETCQEVQLIDIRQMVANFLKDKSPYPVIGICKACGGQRRGLLVPPLAMKFDLAPPLTPLVSQASEAFDDAELIVVVGFSFAEADLYISRLLSKSMQETDKQKLLIVDPDRQVAEKVQRKFKASIPKFDTGRILKIVGDCAENLTKFLAGGMLKKTVIAGGRRGGSIGRPAVRRGRGGRIKS